MLEHGPYEGETGAITGKLAGDGKVTVDIFKPGPDIMGVNANWNTTNSSSPIFANQTSDPTQDVPNDTLRKAPRFLLNLLAGGNLNTRGVFSAAVFGSGAITENTMPYVDKNNQQRIQEESDKKIGRNKVNPVHGNLMVKDVQTIEVHRNAEEKIIEQINEYLGDKAFRLFLFRKLINYFNKEQNLAISVGEGIDRKVNYMVQEFEEKNDSEDDCINVNAPEKLKKKTSDVETDMFGRTFDSVERREFELETNGANGANLFKLYTIKGQLGSGEDVKSDPM